MTRQSGKAKRTRERKSRAPRLLENPYVDIAPRIATSVRELPELDKGIAHAVHLLRAGGIETYQSCEGSWHWNPGQHAFAEPTVQFHGTAHDGLRALAWARQHGLPVRELRRVWKVQDGELVGPTWELTFSRKM